jgi:hypothetical protein
MGEPLVVFDADEVRSIVPLEFAEMEPHTWHPIMPVGTWRHPRHGMVTITDEDVREAAQHFAAQIIGQQVPVDQAEGHSQERDGAFGWLEEVEVRDGGLYGKMTWTSKGLEVIADKRFKYMSPVIHTRDLPFTAQDGTKVPNVVTAVSLTNHPVFKGQPELAINMSEYEAVEMAWAGLSAEDIKRRIDDILNPRRSGDLLAMPAERWYVKYVYEDHAVARNTSDDKYYRVPFTVDANHDVALGEKTEVVQQWVAASEIEVPLWADTDSTPDPETTGGDAMSEQTQEQEAVEAPEEAAVAASEEIAETTTEEQDVEATTEEATTEEEVEEEVEDEVDATSEPDAEAEESVPMSEVLALRERIATLERDKAEAEARGRFEALEFSETVVGEKGRAIRRSSKLAPAALETLTDLYLALPDEDSRAKLVAFAEGDNTRVPLGEWGTQDAVAFAETTTGGIERALERKRETLPDDTVDGAIAFAEAEGLTDAKDADRAVQGYIAKRDNLKG